MCREMVSMRWWAWVPMVGGVLCCVTAAVAAVDPHAPVPKPVDGTVWGPYIRYETPSTATVFWESAEPVAARVAYGIAGEGVKRTPFSAPTRQHVIGLTGLVVKANYELTVETETDGGAHASEPYPLDTTFNYTLPPVPGVADVFGPGSEADLAEQAAEAIIGIAGIDHGYCVVYGCGAGRLALALARRAQVYVVGVDTNPDAIGAGRRALRAVGAYGERITLRHVDDLSDTGLTPFFANLVVSEQVLSTGLDDYNPIGATRLLHPKGKLVVGHPNAARAGFTPAELRVATHGDVVSRAGGVWAVVEGLPFPGAGAWTHQYGDPTNGANSGDTLSGAGATSEMTVQWLGRPGGDFGVDRNPRMPAPLFANGRLFHQGLNRVIALDAHNGAMLWLSEVPGLRRVNLPRDASNWCVDEDHLYMAVLDRCWQLDAATGQVLRTFALPDQMEASPKDWGYVAREGDLLYGSSTLQGSSYLEYFGNHAWYDGTSGAGTYKVCSEALYAYAPATGAVVWRYAGGPIINTTICIGDGRVVLVESRHPSLRNRTTGRIEAPEIWLDQYLVALDAVTGEKLWEAPVDTPDGIVIFFGLYSEGRYVLESSLDGQYHLDCYQTQDGGHLWSAGHPWIADNHSGHMMHPVIVGDRIYLEPMGYDLATGEQVTDAVGRREGCSTYAGTKHALIYRGENRRVAMWDVETAEVTSWSSLRPSCWLSIIPSGGMILAPEGGAGCSCGGWIETSLGFVPEHFLLGSSLGSVPSVGE